MDPEYTDRFLQTVRTAPDESRQEILHRAYASVIQGNFEAFADSVSDDVELHISGFAPMDGAWRGRQQVIDATRNNVALVSNQQPVIESMISQGDCVGVLLRESGILKSTGQPYSIRGVQWFTFSNGKIRRIDQIAAGVTASHPIPPPPSTPHP